MKRLILILIALSLACETPREASNMPSTYTPVLNNNPASITIPSPGDLVAAGVVDQAFKDLADRIQYRIVFADIPGQTGAEPGTKVYVSQVGWWEYSATNVGTADGFWIITATGMGVGQWVNSQLAWVHLGKMAAIGPTPGDTLTDATPAGRINHQYIPHGVVFATVHTPATASNTRSYADPLTASDELTGDALGAIQVGDIIRGNISVGANCANAIRIGVFVTQDNGSTYTLVSPRVSSTLPVDYTKNANAGERVAIDLSFAHVVTSSPTPTFAGYSIRAQGGGSLLTANLSGHMVEVIRP